MFKKNLVLAVTACLFGLVGCFDFSKTSGVTEEQNAIAENSSSSTETRTDLIVIVAPVNYDLWSFNTQDENSGHWFSYDGSDDGSRVLFPVAGEDLSGKAMEAIVDSCGGLCGTVEFGETSNNINVGVGFAVKKDNSSLDASAWNGLCVTYESELDMSMKFNQGETAPAAGDMPFVDLPAAAKTSTRCAKWKDFKMASAKSVSGEDAAKRLSAILFGFKGKPKQKGSFNIKGVASYAGAVAQQQSSSSSVAVVYTSDENCMWNATKDADLTMVRTDFENGGNWFYYTDSEDGGMSVVTFNESRPENVGNFSEWLGELALQDSGIEVKILLERGSDSNREAYAGIGINIAGYEDSGNNVYNPKTADIGSWEGVCVAYTAETDLYLVLEGLVRDEAVLPMSSKPIEVCYNWNAIFSTTGAYKNTSSIRIEARSYLSTETSFKIMGIGKYTSDVACPPYQSSDFGVTVKGTVLNDSCKFSAIDDFWYGPYGVQRVDPYNYGLSDDNENETYGYWGEIADSSGSNAKLTYPVPLGNEYDDRSFAPVIEACGGVCATVSGYGHAGVWFSIAGWEDESMPSTFNLVDVSAWNGLCVTYASEEDLYVAVSNSKEPFDVSGVSWHARVALPKSDVAITKCFTWKNFNSHSISLDPTLVSAIAVYANHIGDDSAKFNILGIGHYQYLNSATAQCAETDPFLQ